MRISDWSSDVCSSDLLTTECDVRATRKAQCQAGRYQHHHHVERRHTLRDQRLPFLSAQDAINLASMAFACCGITQHDRVAQHFFQRNSFVSQHGITRGHGYHQLVFPNWIRSEEHTSELQSLMRISYAVFCLTK